MRVRLNRDQWGHTCFSLKSQSQNFSEVSVSPGGSLPT